MILLFHEYLVHATSTSAEVYKECLDNFLVGLIDGGDVLLRKLLEYEYDFTTTTTDATSSSGTTTSNHQNLLLLDGVDRTAIGTTLSNHPQFRHAVHNISQLLVEMTCVKFVGGQNAASSRRRRRMVQYAAREENLKNAVRSLNGMTASTTATSTTAYSLPSFENHDTNNQDIQRDDCLEDGAVTKHRLLLRSQSLPTATRRFWDEKPDAAATRPRPPPLLRRALTSDEEYDQYKALSSRILPVEKILLAALNRFPLPADVLKDDTTTTALPRQCSSSSSTSRTAVKDGGALALAHCQITGCAQEDTRDDSSHRVQIAQNLIEEEDNATAFQLSSMAIVLSMNFNTSDTSTLSANVDDNALAHHIPEKLIVGSLPLLC